MAGHGQSSFLWCVKSLNKASRKSFRMLTDEVPVAPACPTPPADGEARGLTLTDWLGFEIPPPGKFLIAFELSTAEPASVFLR